MAAHMIRNITVRGTGNMGPGLAVLFGRHGYPVALWAHSPEGREKAFRDILLIAEDLEKHSRVLT